MRRIVITFVSLLAVLVHMHVGCCAHHEHAHATPGCALADHHHDCDSHHSHSAPPVDPFSHDDCHETHCDATLVSPAATPTAIACVWWTPLCLSADELTVAQANGACADRPSDRVGAPPLRAHLRFAVLLI